MLTYIAYRLIKLIRQLRQAMRIQRSAPQANSPPMDRGWSTRRCLQCGIDNYLSRKALEAIPEMERQGLRLACWSCQGELGVDQPKSRTLSSAIFVPKDAA